MKETLYISHEPNFFELAELIIQLDKKNAHYDFICSMETGEILACRIVGDAWEIHR
jgi:hypothetical protein